jgi:hypothetical protein
MKNPELQACKMGNFLCLSAMVQSQWIKSLDKDIEELIITELLELYKMEFLREGIQKLL